MNDQEGRAEPVACDKPRAPLLWRTGVAAAAVFVALCVAAPFGPFPFEEEWLRTLRVPADAIELAGPHWLGSLMRDVTALGGSPVLTLLTALLAGFFALRREWPKFAFLLIVVIGQSLAVDLLKTAFGRSRPDIVPQLAEATSPSFPSGHAASAASVYLLLALFIAPLLKDQASRRYVFFAAAIVALLVGMSRAFLGVHYPSDVIAGWSFGTAWTCFATLLGRRWQVAR